MATCSQVEGELLLAAEGSEQGDGDQASGAAFNAGPGPHASPRGLRDEALKWTIEAGLARARTIDMLIAKHGTSNLHSRLEPGVVGHAFLRRRTIVHR
jgi:hypothetical protein